MNTHLTPTKSETVSVSRDALLLTPDLTEIDASPSASLFQRSNLLICRWLKLVKTLITNRIESFNPDLKLGLSHSDHGHQVFRLSRYLREPAITVQKLLRANHRYNRQLESRRETALESSVLKHHLRTFAFPQQEEYLQLLASDKRSRILVSYHFGDFVYGLNKLGNLSACAGPFYLLSERKASAVYLNNIKKCFGPGPATEVTQLLSSQTNPISLSAVLRKHRSNLVMFCDLPADFGGQVQVDFLNRKARFSKGAAALALINKVPILPVINYFDGRQHRVELASQIEPGLLWNETLADGISRITQQLVAHFEQVFQRHPEQWRFLQRLPLYFKTDQEECNKIAN